MKTLISVFTLLLCANTFAADYKIKMIKKQFLFDQELMHEETISLSQEDSNHSIKVNIVDENSESLPIHVDYMIEEIENSLAITQIVSAYGEVLEKQTKTKEKVFTDKKLKRTYYFKAFFKEHGTFSMAFKIEKI